VCWDGSLGSFNGKSCGCPPVPVEEPEIVEPEPEPEEEEQKVANPNCTNGNADACNRSNGQWDYVSCFCSYPPQNWTTDENTSDDGFEFEETKETEETDNEPEPQIEDNSELVPEDA
jgi:hypothetical protein